MQEKGGEKKGKSEEMHYEMKGQASGFSFFSFFFKGKIGINKTSRHVNINTLHHIYKIRQARSQQGKQASLTDVTQTILNC